MKCDKCDKKGYHKHCPYCGNRIWSKRELENNICDSCVITLANRYFIKAIKKAILCGGWLIREDQKPLGVDVSQYYDDYNSHITEVVIHYDESAVYRYNEDRFEFASERDILFNHNFAKALWGEELRCDSCFAKQCWEGIFYCSDHKTSGTIPDWQYHLQQMIMRSMPKVYLLKYMKERGEN